MTERLIFSVANDPVFLGELLARGLPDFSDFPAYRGAYLAEWWLTKQARDQAWSLDDFYLQVFAAPPGFAQPRRSPYHPDRVRERILDRAKKRGLRVG